MPETPSLSAPVSPTYYYYYTIETRGQTRKGKVDAASVTQAIEQIGQGISEKDMQNGRVNLSVFRLR